MPSPYLASFDSPTPLIPASSASVDGAGDRDRAQGRVVEDHVGGHALLLRGRAAPGPQLLEHRLLLGGQVDLGQLGPRRRPPPPAGPREDRARLRRRRVLPEHDLPLPAQHLPRSPR